MTQPVLISRDSSLLGKARITVLKTLQSSMTFWPPEGVDWNKNCQFQSATEFWVTPEAKECIVLRFGDREVFKVPEHCAIQTWEWYLKRTYPKANVHLLSQSGILPDVSSEKQDSQKDFDIAMLATLFHDMKYWKNESICRNASKWLASLEEPILKPFKFIQDRRHWEDWYLAGSHSQFRKIRVNIFFHDNDIKDIVMKDNSQFFWEQMCLQYQNWARSRLSSQENSDLEERLVKLTNEWEG